MCSFSSKQSQNVHLLSLPHRPWSSKRQLRLSLLKRRRARVQESRRRIRMIGMKAEIEKRNLKLYKENQNIIEENEKLRKQAVLLCIENHALLSQLQKKFSKENNNKTSTSV